jgi:energy-coupling factor transporter ATP-binding protein EcfA2
LRRVARGEIGESDAASRRTLVFVTHETELARELATETWHMKDGRLAKREV